jgi:hypothetical protein
VGDRAQGGCYVAWRSKPTIASPHGCYRFGDRNSECTISGTCDVVSSRTTELRRLSGQQRLVLAVLAIWAVVLAVGLVGGSIGLPRALTAPAGAIALIVLFWFMPGGYLYVLVLDRRRGAIRTKGLGALAIRWRWYFAISGTITVVAGLILLVPSTQVTAEIRLGGAVIVVWGLLALSVAVLAFRMKPWLADPQLMR